MEQFYVFPESGEFRADCARFRPLGFGFNRQRHFLREFGRALTRKSLGRHFGVNILEESTSGNYDDLLNEALFFCLEHARYAIAEWTEDYNTGRPHSALDYQTPFHSCAW